MVDVLGVMTMGKMDQWRTMSQGVFDAPAMESSTCKNCGAPVLRANLATTWRHYGTLREECLPPPVAEPTRDAAGAVVPLARK
jgi:hypothetical protein